MDLWLGSSERNYEGPAQGLTNKQPLCSLKAAFPGRSDMPEFCNYTAEAHCPAYPGAPGPAVASCVYADVLFQQQAPAELGRAHV